MNHAHIPILGYQYVTTEREKVFRRKIIWSVRHLQRWTNLIDLQELLLLLMMMMMMTIFDVLIYLRQILFLFVNFPIRPTSFKIILSTLSLPSSYSHFAYFSKFRYLSSQRSGFAICCVVQYFV